MGHAVHMLMDSASGWIWIHEGQTAALDGLLAGRSELSAILRTDQRSPPANVSNDQVEQQRRMLEEYDKRDKARKVSRQT